VQQLTPWEKFRAWLMAVSSWLKGALLFFGYSDSIPREIQRVTDSVVNSYAE
jgi:hypothetical protein